MNCDLVIANDYGRLLDDIKKLSKKSRLFLEKGAVYQFDLSLVEFALSFPIFCHIKRTLNVLVGNINFTISQILKIIEFFSLYMQFKNKGVGYEDAKKTKKVSCCQRRSKCYSTMNYYYSTILFYAACRIHQQTLYLQWHRILYLHIRIKRDD